jgi:UDP-N-acetyl-D-mannosaminuronate dehydrogenase
MQTVLVVGLGEVGKAVQSIITDSDQFYVDGYDIAGNSVCRTFTPDYLHICFPYTPQFSVYVAGYVKQLKPKLVIIHSTVPVGVTKQIAQKIKCQIAHSPIRGVHKSDEYFKQQLKDYTKFVGSTNQHVTLMAAKHLQECGFKVETMKSSNETELAKLWETTYYGLMIAASQEINRLSQRLGIDYAEVQRFIADTHQARGDRPPMTPGFIGGHCVIPNTLLLQETCRSSLFDFILESNKKRRTELCQSSTAKSTPQSQYTTPN